MDGICLTDSSKFIFFNLGLLGKEDLNLQKAF